jgi:phosphoglycerate dehydrogenase-like enzyme/glyoxylase-like metal-dependent hydrolase (beta-lactamase superfamily II)
MRALSAILGALLAVLPAAAADDLPKMKFNDVAQIAPGVYFRYSSISATDKSVIFGGSNNIWIVFEDYVVVVDANFPTGARECIEAIKKTTDKPIRYVLDTHHHGDHSYGNDIFGQAGASIVAQTNCARLLRVNGPKEFADAGKGPEGRKDVAESKLRVPSVVFDDKLVLDDGKQRVEFLFLGHAHTAGDAVAYLPKQKILCTGDACVNGAFNFMGHSDSASWIRALERMQQLDVQLVCPGHGPLARKDLLERQKRYFVELRDKVREGIAAKKNAKEIQQGLQMAWYKEWTGVEPALANVEHVYGELTGRVAPWDLAEDFGVYEGPSPTKDTPGWKKPSRIVVPSGLMPARLEELKLIAPEVEFVPARTPEEAVKLAADADAVLYPFTAERVQPGKRLRWVQLGGGQAPSAEMLRPLAEAKVVVTDSRQAEGPSAADQAFALLLALTRNLAVKGAAYRPELHGKTLLLVGLDGRGQMVARYAHGCGMRVMAVDDRVQEKPEYVFSLDRPERRLDLLPTADVVVLVGPTAAAAKPLLGAKELQAMKPAAFLVNIAHGSLIDTAALVEALEKKRLAGAGLDVTAPDPLPDDHPLRKLRQVVLSDGQAGRSLELRDRRWRLWRENVRRFVAGEPLLCVVESVKGE